MEKSLTGIIYNGELYNLEGSDKPVNLIVLLAENAKTPEELLNKILRSIGHSRQETSVIKTTGEFDLSEVSFKSLISFGVKLKGLDFRPFNVHREDNRVIILSEPLEVIDDDTSKEKKKKLWELLKANFT